jgi:hypothetical protein
MSPRTSASGRAWRLASANSAARRWSKYEAVPRRRQPVELRALREHAQQLLDADRRPDAVRAFSSAISNGFG